MGGDIALVPPDGFCIDPQTLRQEFALLARCDVLGAPTGAAGAPLGVMTLSLTRVGRNARQPTPLEISAAAGVSAPADVVTKGDVVLYKTRGTPPVDGMDTAHWRALSQVGTVVMGAAFYGPTNGRAVSAEGALMIRRMFAATAAKSAAE
ncbi:hypothetical protein [Sulfitobacter sp. S190]|uniref:hypothetical protein n=1 Tax=Sulfitobacter sp. S190 TaxID=2867022 RepID=UPI0021A7C97C|nr:hypothetical protein [Sulfitobacter sp. S190]UWR22298.1 hypothetical protein K3756_16780 [Sulfitobacter sp. S190]